MPNNNLNLHETKAEEQRYIIGMLPTQLLIKGTPEGKDLVKKLTKKLSKIPKKRQAQVASVFDDLATTQEKGSITKEDIKIVFTSIHGTAVAITPKAFEKAGFTQVYQVAEQAIPSGDFPTVKSPNR